MGKNDQNTQQIAFKNPEKKNLPFLSSKLIETNFCFLFAPQMKLFSLELQM